MIDSDSSPQKDRKIMNPATMVVLLNLLLFASLASIVVQLEWIAQSRRQRKNVQTGLGRPNVNSEILFYVSEGKLTTKAIY